MIFQSMALARLATMACIVVLALGSHGTEPRTQLDANDLKVNGII